MRRAGHEDFPITCGQNFLFRPCRCKHEWRPPMDQSAHDSGRGGFIESLTTANHAAERANLSCLGYAPGLAVAAHLVFFSRQAGDVLVDVVGSGSPPHLLAESAGGVRLRSRGPRYAGTLQWWRLGIAINRTKLAPSLSGNAPAADSIVTGSCFRSPQVPCGKPRLSAGRSRFAVVIFCVYIFAVLLSLGGTRFPIPNYDRRIPMDTRNRHIGSRHSCGAPSAWIIRPKRPE